MQSRLLATTSGIPFFTWRAWTAGTDRDFQTFHSGYSTRVGRLGFAAWFWLKKCARSTQRIVLRGHEVICRGGRFRRH